MPADENKAIIQRFYDEVINGKNLDVLDEIMAENYIDHNAIYGGAIGREGFRRASQATPGIGTAFPDFRNDVDDLIGEGDKVACRWTASGTHQGEFLGIAATGQHIKWGGITIFRLENGKIAERWPMQDRLGFMQQLGAIPGPQV